jgi:hypothetical protein
MAESSEAREGMKKVYAVDEFLKSQAAVDELPCCSHPTLQATIITMTKL